MSDTIEARFNTVLNTNERLKRELSAAKAEIARLTHERDVWQGKAKYYGSEVGAAKAEIARRVADINHLDTRLADALDEIARLTQLLSNLIEWDGGKGSNGYDASKYFGARQAVLATLNPSTEAEKAEIARLLGLGGCG